MTGVRGAWARAVAAAAMTKTSGAIGGGQQRQRPEAARGDEDWRRQLAAAAVGVCDEEAVRPLQLGGTFDHFPLNRMLTASFFRCERKIIGVIVPLSPFQNRKMDKTRVPFGHTEVLALSLIHI